MSKLDRTLHEVAWYPPHDPRKASSEYRHVHHQLVVAMDEPCWICGIKHSTGGNMETHHAELEWAAERAFEDDPKMLAALVADFKLKLAAPDELRQWLDSEGNMLVLCDKHHRGPFTGIHSITYPVWKLQRYQHAGGWEFVKADAS
ncbi:MAG: hypothetical protein KGL39_15165 [Patescibacteria group bacterium]|nr:hypothetical protein [Patescibacteria group bacterium]